MWDWVFWGSLIVAVLAASAGLVLLALYVRQAWLTFKDARRHAADALGDLAAKGEETAAKAEAAGDTVELQESVARLRVSLARLAVLQAALDEAEDAAGRVTAFVPHA